MTAGRRADRSESFGEAVLGEVLDRAHEASRPAGRLRPGPGSSRPAAGSPRPDAPTWPEPGISRSSGGPRSARGRGCCPRGRRPARPVPPPACRVRWRVVPVASRPAGTATSRVGAARLVAGGQRTRVGSADGDRTVPGRGHRVRGRLAGRGAVRQRAERVREGRARGCCRWRRGPGCRRRWRRRARPWPGPSGRRPQSPGPGWRSSHVARLRSCLRDFGRECHMGAIGAVNVAFTDFGQHVICPMWTEVIGWAACRGRVSVDTIARSRTESESTPA